ncbi:SDR family NAD(P)-dependent oxidoreductase [Cucumibacter marinus]|uniref:SDR family NAD(P)-dependent oxidoreductase n=1 Tax=Cucumibacter marinus TaxID=1121252 RepID=UPI000419F04C|nr:SDR family NAD(P)-dependent oxidoreductase [Cucumibacter marinus]
MRLEGKRALLIGAATGIGQAVGEDFARNGAKLAIADINETGVNELVRELDDRGATCFGYGCDVRNEKSVADVVAAAERDMGGLDTLVYFAGLMRTAPVTEIEADVWDAIFAVNARGTMFAAKYGAPALRRAGGGSFITTSSLAGLRGAPGMTAYASAKGAVLAFTTALAQELAPDNIRVNSVLPGWIDTPFNTPAIEFMGGEATHGEIVKKLVPLGRQGVPEEVAPMYTFLASEESRYITAKQMMVDGGMAH